jgi:hypothetical protein
MAKNIIANAVTGKRLCLILLSIIIIEIVQRNINT